MELSLNLEVKLQLSWQNFYAKNTNKGLIVRYEDLVLEPEKHYYLILKFISDLLNIKIDKIKFQNCLDTVTFENMKKFENKFGFNEKSKKAKHFFRSGKIDEWKKILDFDSNLSSLSNDELRAKTTIFKLSWPT